MSKHSTASQNTAWLHGSSCGHCPGHNRHAKLQLVHREHTHTPHSRSAEGRRQASCSRRHNPSTWRLQPLPKSTDICQDSVRRYIRRSSDLAEHYPRAEGETQSHVTSAPSTMRVSMSTAVCTVMWRQPAMRAPFRGLDAEYISLIFISPGISFSAISMALRPQSARLMSAAREAGQVSEFE